MRDGGGAETYRACAAVHGKEYAAGNDAPDIGAAGGCDLENTVSVSDGQPGECCFSDLDPALSDGGGQAVAAVYGGVSTIGGGGLRRFGGLAWYFLAILPWSAVWKGLLLFLCLAGAYYRGISYGLLFSLPAAAVLRMMERTGDSFLLLCILTVMISSFFRELGKGAVALGGVLGGLVLLLLFQGQVVIWELASLCGAGLCFIWVPGKLYERFLWGRTLQEEAGAGEVRTMQQHMSRMLSRSSAAMEELGTVLRESNREKSLNSLDTGRILEDLSERVCGNCEYHSSCWGERFSETYETIGAIMEAARYKGIIEKKDIPLFFLNRCNNSEEFIKRTNRHYELYRLNLSWENRMRRGAQIAAEELGCMAGMLQNLRNYLCTQLELDQNMSRRIQEELERGNLPIQRSQVVKDLKTGRYTLNMQIGTGYNKKLKVQLESRVSALLGIPVQVTDSRMIRQGLWDWKMEETCRLRVDGSILSRGVEIVSGDSTWMGQLPGGRYVAAISDGMGVGDRAGGESERALYLLRLILNAGAEEAEAIRLLNSMLLLSGTGTFFNDRHGRYEPVYRQCSYREGGERGYNLKETGTHTDLSVGQRTGRNHRKGGMGSLSGSGG